MQNAMYPWYGLLVSISLLYGVAATMEEMSSVIATHNLNPSARYKLHGVTRKYYSADHYSRGMLECKRAVQCDEIVISSGT